MEPLYRCWAEINLDQLKNNYIQIKKGLNNRTMILSVIKADAYGHGAVKLAQVLEQLNTDWFAVAELGEARSLRKGGITRPILVLGPTYPEQFKLANELDVTLSVSSLEGAMKLDAAAQELGVRQRVHIQLDTGMGRYGFDALDPETAINEIEKVCKLHSLEVTGIYTHFATADGKSQEDINFLKKQHWLFYNIIKALKSRRITFRIIHCANSATAMRFPQLQYNMVRAGIALYGLSPSGEPIEGFDLKPVMSLRSRIARIHTIQAGQPIGYGCTFIADRPTRIAVVTAGYADGVPRTLSNKGYVSFADGSVAPIVGNVCMDALFIDVTDTPSVKEGDTVTLFGNGPVTADTVAGLTGTISYEVLCGVSRRVPRLYFANGKYLGTIDYTKVIP